MAIECQCLRFDFPRQQSASAAVIPPFVHGAVNAAGGITYQAARFEPASALWAGGGPVAKSKFLTNTARGSRHSPVAETLFSRAAMHPA